MLSRHSKEFTLAEVFHPFRQSKRIAFTLAEVLITLGIIGIVAAITMPVLISKYNKMVTETNLKRSYNLLNEAFSRSQAENGPAANWGEWPAHGHGGTSQENEDMFNKYFAPYLNVVGDASLAIHTGPIKWKKLSDGSYISFGMNADYVNNKYGEVLIILPGSPKKESDIVIGKHVFKFLIMTRQRSNETLFIGVYRTADTYAKDPSIRELIKSYCNPKSGYTAYYCTELVVANDFKFPDDYPVKF